MLIKKIRIYYLALCLLLCASVAQAQKDSVVAPVSEEDAVDETTSIYETSFKASFDSINAKNTTVVTQRKNTGAAIDKLKKDDDFWYANATEKKEVANNGKPFSFWESFFKLLSNDTFRKSVWIALVILMIGAIILYLKYNQINLFASSTKNIKSTDTDYNTMPENIFEIDYEAAIATALANNNYRIATRFLFLRSLKTLSSKQIIKYSSDKTNFDYLFEIGGTIHYNSFANAARNYEYLWYGNFEVNAQQFELIKKGFDNFQQQLAA